MQHWGTEGEASSGLRIIWTLGQCRGEGREGNVPWFTKGKGQYEQPGPLAGRHWVPSSPSDPSQELGPLGTAESSLAQTALMVSAQALAAVVRR